jgi:uncharacterized protein
MKPPAKFLIFLLLICSPLLLLAQAQPENIKSIEVTGSAEMEVAPDIIYLEFELTEYKTYKVEITVEQKQKQIIEILKSLKIDESALSVANIWGREYKRRNQDLKASKKYLLKLTDFRLADSLVIRFDKLGIDYLTLVRTDHSQMAEFRKLMKIQAIKNAKEKAAYLLEAVDEKLGELIEVKELENVIYPQIGAGLWSNTRVANSFGSGEEGNSVQIRKLKIRYEIQTKFRIK